MNVVEAIDQWIDANIDDFSDDELYEVLQALDVIAAHELATFHTHHLRPEEFDDLVQQFDDPADQRLADAMIVGGLHATGRLRDDDGSIQRPEGRSAAGAAAVRLARAAADDASTTDKAGGAADAAASQLDDAKKSTKRATTADGTSSGAKKTTDASEHTRPKDTTAEADKIGTDLNQDDDNTTTTKDDDDRHRVFSTLVTPASTFTNKVLQSWPYVLGAICLAGAMVAFWVGFRA